MPELPHTPPTKSPLARREEKQSSMASANKIVEPTTPVRIPKATQNYTLETKDPQLRSQINEALLAGGHIERYVSPKFRKTKGRGTEFNSIRETLLHALHASPTDWPTLIQSHALSLLRSGEVTTFPALLSRVLSDVKAQSEKKDGEANGEEGTVDFLCRKLLWKRASALRERV